MEPWTPSPISLGGALSWGFRALGVTPVVVLSEGVLRKWLGLHLPTPNWAALLSKL